jgi:hypothetical protein
MRLERQAGKFPHDVIRHAHLREGLGATPYSRSGLSALALDGESRLRDPNMRFIESERHLLSVATRPPVRSAPKTT